MDWEQKRRKIVRGENDILRLRGKLGNNRLHSAGLGFGRKWRWVGDWDTELGEWVSWVWEQLHQSMQNCAKWKKLTDFTPSSLLFFFFLSLFFIYKTNPPSHVLSSSDTTHSHKHKIKNQLPKSKINYQNQKSTTRTKSLDRCWWKSMKGLMWIGFDGDRCWWSACNGLMERMKEKDSQKKKEEGEEREAEIEIRMVWRRGYSEEKEVCWWSACDGLTEKRNEKESKKINKNKKEKMEKKERRR